MISGLEKTLKFHQEWQVLVSAYQILQLHQKPLSILIPRTITWIEDHRTKPYTVWGMN